MSNRYIRKVNPNTDEDIFTVDEWKEAINEGCFSTYDGCGYWVKDGLISNDEVFSTPVLDATHVVWYNK